MQDSDYSRTATTESQGGLQPAEPEMPEEESINRDRLKRTMNTTAYRIFKLFGWLQQEPMTMEVIQERFRNDSLTGKSLSTDSIWLYLNTLKALGCEISRPSPTNQFHYTLTGHPFHTVLTTSEWALLANVKTRLDETWSYQEILTLDHLLTRLGKLIRAEEAGAKNHYDVTRSVDYGQQTPLLNLLEQSIDARELLLITYQSTQRGISSFYFLPEQLHYENGALYLQGSRLQRAEAVNLRVDHIHDAIITENPEVESALRELQGNTWQVQLTLYISEHFQSPFHLMYDTPLEWFSGLGKLQNVGKCSDTALSLTLQTRDLFRLKQTLLSLGMPFRIHTPEAFRLEMEQTLSRMQACYAATTR
ncbi:MAG: helix-turn-helix transcriptional regulator [Candidatus Melainabacteria bacterium]